MQELDSVETFIITNKAFVSVVEALMRFLTLLKSAAQLCVRIWTWQTRCLLCKECKWAQLLPLINIYYLARGINNTPHPGEVHKPLVSLLWTVDSSIRTLQVLWFYEECFSTSDCVDWLKINACIKNPTKTPRTYTNHGFSYVFNVVCYFCSLHETV